MRKRSLSVLCVFAHADALVHGHGLMFLHMCLLTGMCTFDALRSVYGLNPGRPAEVTVAGKSFRCVVLVHCALSRCSRSLLALLFIAAIEVSKFDQACGIDLA